jgi:hypothetical protein
LQFERRLLADELALVPSFRVGRGTNSIHGDLLSVEGDSTLRRVLEYNRASPRSTAAMEKGGRSSNSDPEQSSGTFAGRH